MKHLKISVKLDTMLNEDFSNISNLKNDKESYDNAIKKAFDFCVKKESEEKEENKYKRSIMSLRKDDETEKNVKVYGDIVKKINDMLLPECNKKISIMAIYMSKRDIQFVAKINDKNTEKEISKINQKIENLLYMNKDIILYEGEILISINFAIKEISIKEYWFESIGKAEAFGLNVKKYMQLIDEKQVGIEFYKYEELNREEFLYEYNVKKSLTKKEFVKKYKELLYNKTFSNEIDRIYNSKNKYKVEINPVHYEFTSYDQNEKIEMFKALGEALYSNGRIKNRKIVRIKIDLFANYISNEELLFLINNCIDSFVFVEFLYDHRKHRYTVDEYLHNGQIKSNELVDNIINLKDKILFAFYIDKYQERIKDEMRNKLEQLKFVRFDDKITPERTLSFVKELAKKENIEVTDRLINEVKMQKDDMTINDAKTIFEDYKDYIVSHKYFPEYKDYYEGIGGVDNYVDPYEKLMSLPGLKNVKETITDIINFHNIEKYRKEHFIEYKNKNGVYERYNGNSVSMHMIFMGNPGTCKTTVAKLVAKIFKSRGIIKTDKTEFYGVEGRYYTLERAFEYAKGGILFIDEAYSLSGITKLVALMEEHRKDVIVILAGYIDRMREFMKSNEGLNSRIKYKIEFENYNENELWEILKYQANEKNMIIDDSVKEKIWPIFSSNQCDKELGNGRLVRNILDMAMVKQAKRFNKIDLNKELYDLSKLNILVSDDFDIEYKKIVGKAMPKIIGNEDPEIELANMVGIDNVKNMLKKIIASVKVNKARREICDGINVNESMVSSPMHLAFLGNPGTCKTTVARLFARILKKKGIIKKETIVEVGRNDLVGKYVGWTAPMVEAQFEKAKGGILFIDEAYSLVDEREGSFGDEAINTIIQQMENRRDEVIVIFAGYTDRMRKFIERNEGLRSRLSYILEFKDYTEEELYNIFEKFLTDNKLVINNGVEEKVKEIIIKQLKNKDFGNGRFIRNLIEKAKINMDYRLSMKIGEYTKEELTTFEVSDFDNLEMDEVLDGEKEYKVGFGV